MVPDTEVLTRAGIPSIHTLLQKAQVRWAGHVARMPDERQNNSCMVSSATANGQLVGKRNKRFKDNLKKTLTRFNIDVTIGGMCPGSTHVAQYDSKAVKNGLSERPKVSRSTNKR